MEDLKIIEEGLELATQKGIFSMNDIYLLKQSLENLKAQFKVEEILPINQTAPIKEVVTT